MAISEFLLNILVCPETKMPVALASKDLIEKLNQQIEKGSVTNRAGQPVSELLLEGLLREDGAYLYPIRDDIPIMLIEEGISIQFIKQ